MSESMSPNSASRVCTLMAAIYDAESAVQRGEMVAPGWHLRPDPAKTADLFRQLAAMLGSTDETKP